MTNKKCAYCGSIIQVRNYKQTGIYVCSKHYMQLDRHGMIKRTKYDSNIFKISYKHNIVLMKIYDSFGNYKTKTIFDLKHLERIKNHKWCVGSHNHVITTIDNKNVKLHRFILNAQKGEIVKHATRNLLNNLESNLILIKD